MDGAFHSGSFVSEFLKSTFKCFSIGFKNYRVNFVDSMKISEATQALLVFICAATLFRTVKQSQSAASGELILH